MLETEPVVGWGQAASEGTTFIETVSTVLGASLKALGVEEVFTIVGGGIAPLIDALQKCKLRIRHFRHEAGAAFAAHEASVVSGLPVAVCVTTGPGIYNALTGLAAARTDGGRIVLLSGVTSPAIRGKGAVQETGPDTMLSEIFTPGNIFNFAKIIADASELPLVLSKLQVGLQRKGGFIAHLALPLTLQSTPAAPITIPHTKVYEARASREALQEIIALLHNKRFGVWVGYGALHAAQELKTLVQRTGCNVIATPRAKGIFCEWDAHYIGVSGAGAHQSVTQYMKDVAPEILLVLGSRLGEVSSFFSPAMIPSQGFIQVDTDVNAFACGYPQVKTVGVCADIRLFLEDLLALMPADFTRQPSYTSTLKSTVLAPRAEKLVRTPFLFQEVQRLIVEGSDAIVMAESGNSFAWANHALRFAIPGRYRTSALFGSMGHFVTGVVGAALVRCAKAVVLTGDGAMLMNNEINTAVAYKAQAVWIVLNDARFGLTEHGMKALNLAPVETDLPLTDFALFAKSQGADGLVVYQESELASALEIAMQATTPFVLDVRIDRNDFAPLLANRVASIAKQRSGDDY